MGDQAVGYALGGAHVTAIDASEAMLGAARERAARAEVSVRFDSGDATALGFEDDSFDACRSERVLQWVPDMAAALDEMRRVVRPGGRICVVDTDWRTLAADLPDLHLTRKLGDAFLDMRGTAAAAGGRLLNLCRDVGLVQLECTADAHVWTEWDPEVEPNPSGLFPLRVVAPQLVELGVMTAEDTDALVDGLTAAGAAGRVFMSLTMTAVCGRVPAEA
jgi:SAM-dependent methyltransferase